MKNINNFYDITGEKHGKLTALKKIPKKNNESNTRWLCLCDCGNLTEVNKGNLMNGHTKSCGCYALDIRKNNHANITHGLSHSRLYHIWTGIKQRCENKKTTGYKYYGGRGISVCDEWQVFNNFVQWAHENGYNECLTIDRVDNNGNYTPDNCRWATAKQQNRNKSINREIVLDGQKKTMAEWCEILNIPMSTVSNRLNMGLSPENALNTKYYKRTNKKESYIKRMNLYLAKMTDGQASKILGIQRSSFSAWRTKNGLPSQYGPGGILNNQIELGGKHEQ